MTHVATDPQPVQRRHLWLRGTHGACVALLLVWSAAHAAHAAPQSTDYTIERIVPASAFHGVHGLAFDRSDRLYAGSVEGEAIYRVDTVRGTATLEIAPPDGMADDLTYLPDGTLAWTSVGEGVVRVRDPSGSMRVIASGLPGVNSIAARKSDGRLFVSQVFGADALWELDPTGQNPPRAVRSQLDQTGNNLLGGSNGFGGLDGFDFGPDGMIYGPLWFAHQIVRIDPDTGELSAINSDFGIPSGAKFDSQGNLYVVDTQRGELSVVDIQRGEKCVIAALAPALDNLAIDSRDHIFVSNFADNAIQEVDPATGHVRTLLEGKLAFPMALAAVPAARGDELFVADTFAFRSVESERGRVQEIARVFAPGSPIQYPLAVTANERHVVLVNSGGLVQRYDARSHALLQSAYVDALENLSLGVTAASALELPDDSLIVLSATGSLFRSAAGVSSPIAFHVDGPAALALAAPDALYVADILAGALFRVALSDGSSQPIRSSLQLTAPQRIAVARDGSLVIADAGANRLVRLDPASGQAVVVADGLPMPIPDSSNPSPVGLAIGADGSIYVTAAAENSIYRLRPR